jgi:hypothetical protein
MLRRDRNEHQSISCRRQCQACTANSWRNRYEESKAHPAAREPHPPDCNPEHAERETRPRWRIGLEEANQIGNFRHCDICRRSLQDGHNVHPHASWRLQREVQLCRNRGSRIPPGSRRLYRLEEYKDGADSRWRQLPTSTHDHVREGQDRW